MAKVNVAAFAQSRRSDLAVATAAKTTYTDAANAVRLLRASAEGGILRRVTAIARATVTATQLQLYRSKDAGATLILWRTRLMPAATMAQTTEMPLVDFGIDFTVPTGLAPNEEIWFGIGVALAAGVAASAEWEDYAP